MNNHERAASIVSKWPQWKRDVTISQYSERERSMRECRHGTDISEDDCMNCDNDASSIIGCAEKIKSMGADAEVSDIVNALYELINDLGER